MRVKNYYIELSKSQDYKTLEELLTNLDYLGLSYELDAHYHLDYRTKKPKPFIDAPYWVELEINKLNLYDSPRSLSPNSLEFICNTLAVIVDISNLSDEDLIHLNDFVEDFIKERFN